MPGVGKFIKEFFGVSKEAVEIKAHLYAIPQEDKKMISEGSDLETNRVARDSATPPPSQSQVGGIRTMQEESPYRSALRDSLPSDAMPVTTAPPPPSNVFDDDDDDGWQDMPVVRDDFNATELDEEDRKKYHYQSQSNKTAQQANATGTLIDIDDMGYDWRSKADQNESEYTRLRMQEEDENDEVHLRTKYLFDEDKAMTPLSQMQATKKLLTEAQRIAYVGLCALTAREMLQQLKLQKRKELKAAAGNMELWSLKIMGRLYYHMELETQEQKMIEQLAEHGVQAMDLVPSLMTTHTVANPEYDPEEARRRTEAEAAAASRQPDHPDMDDADDISVLTLVEPSPQPPKDADSAKVPPQTPTSPNYNFSTSNTTSNPTQTTAQVLNSTTTSSLAGVTTTLSSADKSVTLDIRWTILCDLFLILIADSVYDARSRVLLERVAEKLGLGWIDVVRFESRVTEALEIQEGIEKLEQQEIVEGVKKAGKRRRYMMMGLATLGGGLVIGLSAGLLAPVIGVGLAGAFTTIGITGTGAFLGGTAGAAAITTGGVLTGGAIAGHGMAKRTREVRTFDILPLHNNKRVNCILTVSGFMTGINDDVRLPFSVLDPIVGDVFSVLWEPEMIRETGSALKIMTQEVLSQVGLTILQATAMTALMSALQWPIILTKLGYLIDNPWSNALDRAKAAGKVLADVLLQRHLGVRPITLIGFSLGARVIFYALLELARLKAYGIVQDVFLLGATLTASQNAWIETRTVVSGRYVNAFAKNDWVLNYLFRATSGGVGTVAGLRAVGGVEGLENVEVTDKIAGHMSYRTFMPLILDQLGFPVSADYFDEPVEPDFTEDRIVVREEEAEKNKKGWFGKSKKKKSTSNISSQYVSRPPTASSYAKTKPSVASTSTPAPVAAAATALPPINALGEEDDEDLPPRMASPNTPTTSTTPRRVSTEIRSSAPTSRSATPRPHTPATPNSPSRPSDAPSTARKPEKDEGEEEAAVAHIPKHAGFDLDAMRKMIGQAVNERPEELKVSPSTVSPLPSSTATLGSRVGMGVSAFGGGMRSVSAPIPPSAVLEDERKDRLTKQFAQSFSLRDEEEDAEDVGYTGAGGGRGASSPSMSSYRPPPTLSFGSDFETPSWGSSSSSAMSPPTTTFRSPPSTIQGFTSPSHNPFAMSSTPSLAFSPSTNESYGSFGMGMDSSSGLSFGSADGTISTSDGVSPSGGRNGMDAWVVPGHVGRKAGSGVPGFGANPWA
ncbi:hypothetical protein NP233_g3269 [Leucocoprinus birnbaumii]|uniref:DUF726-domain-containing protein n=1 Tax=Leucocoprinus birnbaumii TaxID=56174 RepID=A0AAD5VWV7_9AGAR|nr:hypothetical protein NP233_g3269 [Leucocoprinus birnbaumii]